MRKVKHNIQMQDSAASFANGIESLINDPLYQPSSRDQTEIARTRRAAYRQDSRGNLFGSLMKQFATH